MHRSPGICLTAEENSRKPQQGDCLMKGLCTDLLAFALQLKRTPENLSKETVWWTGWSTSHRLKWGPFPPNEIGRIAQHVGKGEGRKEGRDGVGSSIDDVKLLLWSTYPQIESMFIYEYVIHRIFANYRTLTCKTLPVVEVKMRLRYFCWEIIQIKTIPRHHKCRMNSFPNAQEFSKSQNITNRK